MFWYFENYLIRTNILTIAASTDVKLSNTPIENFCCLCCTSSVCIRSIWRFWSKYSCSRNVRTIQGFNQRNRFISRWNIFATPLKNQQNIHFLLNRKELFVIITSGIGGLAIIEPIVFCKALIWSKALNGALQIGQLLAWYLRESAQPLHRHKCLQGKIRVSRTSHIQMTHSAPLSSASSSFPCCCWKQLLYLSAHRFIHDNIDKYLGIFSIFIFNAIYFL